MEFKSLKSKQLQNINISKHLINWDSGGSSPHLKSKIFLSKYWRYDVVLEEFPLPGSRLRIDILNISKRIAVEVSPDATHNKYTEFFHGTRNGFLGSVKRDFDKAKWCDDNDILLIEFDDEFLKNMSAARFLEKFGMAP
jgi:hypothetical protein